MLVHQWMGGWIMKHCPLPFGSKIFVSCTFFNVYEWFTDQLLPLFCVCDRVAYILTVYINSTVTITVCSYGPIYLRHYYLLRLPVLQTQLFNYETMVDPEKYKKLSRSLVRTKFLSSEAGAWMFFAINFIPLMGIGIYYL
ncbi:expressed protein, partial [Batrachochytrium dendrobatidis JAM81]